MYVDALFDKDANVVHVVERVKGKRKFIEYPANYQFFIKNPKGKHRSIYNEPLERIRCKTYKSFQQELKRYSSENLYESDLNQTFICLGENYMHADPPELNVCFFDIEVDMQMFAYSSQHMVKIKQGETEKTISVFQLSNLTNIEEYKVYDEIKRQWVDIHKCRYLKPGPGYSSPADALTPITAISLHLQWLDALVTLTVPPKTITFDEARELVHDLPNTIVCESEKHMLELFLQLVEDVDVFSGWNSTGYDIPYTVNRITRILSKEHTKLLCLWDKFPKPREFEKYGKIATTYDLVGKVHLDYLELYQKYTYEEQSSYRLDYIGQIEVNESKTVYEGTLDQLYNNDFRTFIIYNRQDVALLNKLDIKLKFINTANALAHANTVLLQTTMGAVAVTEQAIINEAHELGYRVPSRSKKKEGESTQAAGAYVAYPRKGLHKWVGSLDINSLYPSTIRALNMGPETIFGQIRLEHTDAYIKQKMDSGESFAASWEGMFATIEYDMVMKNDPGTILTVDFSDGNTTQLSSAQIYNMIFDPKNKLMMSANATIFSYDREGIIPGLLKKWYAERKQMQKTLKNFQLLEQGIDINDINKL
jgi:hypothetical protein